MSIDTTHLENSEMESHHALMMYRFYKKEHGSKPALIEEMLSNKEEYKAREGFYERRLEELHSLLRGSAIMLRGVEIGWALHKFGIINSEGKLVSDKVAELDKILEEMYPG